jgi:signal transduction histidine kinase
MGERGTVIAVVGEAPVDSLTDTFDLVTVEAVSGLVERFGEREPEQGHEGHTETAVDEDDGTVSSLDCVVCPTAAVAAVREHDATVPVVAVVAGDDGADVALTQGATDVLPEDAPRSLVTTRVENAIDSQRLSDAETELAAERTLLGELFERVPIHLYVKDEAGRHVRVSNAYVENPDSFIGERDVDLADSPHTRSSYADDRYVIETGEPIIGREEDITAIERAGWSMEHYLEQYDSIDPPSVTEEWVLTSKVPRYDDRGNVVGLIGVTRDISERKQYQRRLEAQNERLDEFAAIVSHDLRNPLNVAEGYLDLARGEGDSAHLDRIDVALDRIRATIDDVLTLARKGQAVEATTAVDLAVVVHEVWTTNRPRDTATLVVDDLPTVDADTTRLRRLVENLLGNAVEHGSTSSQPAADDAVEHGGPEVTVHVEWFDDGETQGFAVDDDGVGIPVEDHERVFERGYTTSESGTGFGLAIVERLAAAHGWSVSLTASDRGGARIEIHGIETV